MVGGVGSSSGGGGGGSMVGIEVVVVERGRPGRQILHLYYLCFNAQRLHTNSCLCGVIVVVVVVVVTWR